jgi:hypothetical protein
MKAGGRFKKPFPPRKKFKGQKIKTKNYEKGIKKGFKKGQNS